MTAFLCVYCRRALSGSRHLFTGCLSCESSLRMGSEITADLSRCLEVNHHSVVLSFISSEHWTSMRVIEFVWCQTWSVCLCTEEHVYINIFITLIYPLAYLNGFLLFLYAACCQRSHVNMWWETQTRVNLTIIFQTSSRWVCIKQMKMCMLYKQADILNTVMRIINFHEIHPHRWIDYLYRIYANIHANIHANNYTLDAHTTHLTDDGLLLCSSDYLWAWIM